MPRRSPGEIRGQLRLHHRRPGTPAVIRGLSPSANREIAQFERRHALPQGEVAHAVHYWSRPKRRPPSHLFDPYYADRHDDWYQGDCHPRTLIEHALRTLRKRARRRLLSLVAPHDARVLTGTLNNPFAPVHLPWWERRL
ncbi:hypothetical protein MTF65_28060 [Streptomyces sp. APSN-46.1]|uniref:hypothetical protein n=1 Tax=Streptomyces sp. APSN-46.1 TaxID=2929049 RepID=UPI001FB424B3|nr:hypothetical protein [Streptomyces sp. APSN-46.1]MCJ1681139.1 hypothetical protein [Streptomyces sp. APSN-46.1]